MRISLTIQTLLTGTLALSACSSNPAAEDLVDISEASRSVAASSSDEDYIDPKKVQVDKGKKRKVDLTIASTSSEISSKACGHLYYSESTHTALNRNEVGYVLRVACGGSKETLMQFEDGSIKVGQKRSLTKWRGLAARGVALNKDPNVAALSRRSAPYVCFRGIVNEKPCTKSDVVAVKEVENFTTLSTQFDKWEE